MLSLFFFRSPGFGLSLVAESTTGALTTAECFAKAGETPEDLGRKAAKMLLAEIQKGGCADTLSHSLNLLLMTLCPPDVCKIRLGKLTPGTVQFMRDLKVMFGQVFRIDTDQDSKTIIVTGTGTGYTNLNKNTT